MNDLLPCCMPRIRASCRGVVHLILLTGCICSMSYGGGGTGLAAADLAVREDADAGSWTILEGERPVLVYRYKTQKASSGFLAGVHPDNLKYARDRSDYIHPLYGLEGEVLTGDWPVDHPHHRGIYWAWPEVGYRGGLGDLHALQGIFARPTNECEWREDGQSVWIEARSQWFWEDHEPVVRETARIRVWKRVDDGRAIDLKLTFHALADGVTLARRETALYGGLNLRFAGVEQQEIICYVGPEGDAVQQAWADIAGIFPGAEGVEGVTILQHPDNPDFPGDWVQYPELNWVQPTFPRSGTRHPLIQGEPLVLRYRLWVHRGRATEASLYQAWRAYLNAVPFSGEP